MSAEIWPWYLSCCGVGSGGALASGSSAKGGGAEAAAAEVKTAVSRAIFFNQTRRLMIGGENSFF